MKNVKAIILVLFLSFMVSGCGQNKVQSTSKRIRDLTCLAHESISFFYSLQQSKILSEATAKERAKSLINSFRYGTAKKNYFFILNKELKMVMHPYVKKLEGKDVSVLTDKKGKPMFQAMRQVCEASGEGFVDYSWQYKNQNDKIVTKIAFVKIFKPWNWIVGTSLYVID